MLKIREFISSRKYLLKISLLVTVSVFLLISIFALTVYFNIEKKVLENENGNIKKIFYQIKYNIENTNNIVKDMCTYIYFNNNTISLMYEKKLEYSDAVYKLLYLQKMVSYNSFIYSIDVYNDNMKMCFSTLKNITDWNGSVNNMFDSNGSVPKLQPLFITDKTKNLDGTYIYSYYFSYYMYDNANTRNKMTGLMACNVKADWFLDNIKMLNIVDNSKGEGVFILDGRGEIINDSPEKTLVQSEIEKVYNEKIAVIDQYDNVYDLFIKKINQQYYLISYIHIDEMDWTIMKIQPYSEAYRNIKQLKLNILIIFAIFIVLAFAISISISNRIYKPINNLIKTVHGDSVNKYYELKGKDEIVYLSDIYKQNGEKLKLYVAERNINRDITKNYYLKQLLMNSSSIREEEASRYKNDQVTELVLDQPFIIGILMIDNYKKFQKENSSSKELLKFSIMNISHEIMSTADLHNEVIDMGSDHLVVFVNENREPGNFYVQLRELFSEVQNNVAIHFGISLSVNISEKIYDLWAVTTVYNKTLEGLLYRYVYGKMCILTPDTFTKRSKELDFKYPDFLENRLVEEIRCKNNHGIEEALLGLLCEISEFSYNHILLSLVHLANTLKSTANEMSKMRIEPANLNLKTLVDEIYEAETIEEIYWKFMDAIKEMIKQKIDDINEKHRLLVETVKDIINANYYDCNLGLQQIADILKMSPVYLGKIFSDCCYMTVMEYTNDVRMSKALEWMKNSELRISQIIDKVGIESVSYFYKLFKKKYGVTPKEYILKQTISG